MIGFLNSADYLNPWGEVVNLEADTAIVPYPVTNTPDPGTPSQYIPCPPKSLHSVHSYRSRDMKTLQPRMQPC